MFMYVCHFGFFQTSTAHEQLAETYTKIYMEKINFNYSLKNIPVPSKSSYKLKLIDKIENVIKRMRWKAQFFINGDSTETKK